jgi:hypothetical protein
VTATTGEGIPALVEAMTRHHQSLEVETPVSG